MMAEKDLAFANFGKCHKLMAALATDGAGIRSYRAASQPAAAKGAGIGIIHFIIRNIQPRLIAVKGIEVLHDKLAGADNAKAGAAFIAEFGLNLIWHLR